MTSFSAFLENTNSMRSMVNIVKSVSVKNMITIAASDMGLKFYCKTTSLLASAYVPKEFFTPYNYYLKEDVLRLCVDAPTFISCLCLHMSNETESRSNSFIISCSSPHGPLELTVRESLDTVSVCKLCVFDADTNDEFDDSSFLNFDSHPAVFHVIMKADWLLDTLQELTKVDFIKITVDKSSITFSGKGPQGSAEVKCPSSTVERFGVFQEQTMQFRFSCAFFQMIMASLTHSSKSSIRANEAGFLNVQSMISFHDASCFIDVTLAPLEN